MNKEKQSSYYKLIVLISFWILFATFVLNPLILRFILKDPESGKMFSTIILQMVGFVLPIGYIVYKHRKTEVLFLDDVYENKKFKLINIPYIILIAVFMFLAILTLNFAFDSFRIYLSGVIPEAESSATFSLKIFLVGVVSLALIPAIYEEFVYRGIFYNISNSFYVKYIICVIPFTLIHYPAKNVVAAFVFANFMFLIRNKKSLINLHIIHFIYGILMAIFLNYILLSIDPNKLVSKIVDVGEFLKYGFLSLFLALVFGVLTYLVIEFWKKDDKKGKVKNREYIPASVVLITIGIFVMLFLSNFAEY